ncbi:hypothetical protein [Xanthomonas theicola]
MTGPRKSRRLHGYLLKESGCLFDRLAPNNPYLCLKDGVQNHALNPTPIA